MAAFPRRLQKLEVLVDSLFLQTLHSLFVNNPNLNAHTSTKTGAVWERPPRFLAPPRAVRLLARLADHAEAKVRLGLTRLFVVTCINILITWALTERTAFENPISFIYIERTYRID